MTHSSRNNAIRVCHVCSGHTSDDSRVFHKECRSLAQAGYEVHLVATDKKPTSYKSGDVTIHPLSFPKSRFERLSRRWAVADIAARVSADLYHVHEPELLGPVLNRVDNKPVIYDVHESYLDLLGHRSWIPTPVRPLVQVLWQRLEAKYVRRCRAIVTVAEPIAERYLKLHERVEIIRNFPDLSRDVFNSVSSNGREPACVLAGTLNGDRNLANMVRAIGLLRRRNVSISLWLAGQWDSPEYERAIQKLAADEGVSDQVRYSGVLSHKDAVALESRASIGMATVLPTGNFLKTLLIKLFECMALGLPVIYSNFPLFQSYVRDYGVGVAVDPEKPDQIADALEYLMKNPQIAQEMGKMGKRVVMEKYNWVHEGTRLLALYHEILGARLTDSR